MSLFHFLSQLRLAIKYYLILKDHKFIKFPLLNRYSGKSAQVIVNGPSLKKTLELFDSGQLEITSDSFFVNMGALDSHFSIIKPKHYCLSDPMFYQDFALKKDVIRKTYEVLNTVDWDINLYLCFFTEKECKQLIAYSGITNPHVRFVFVNRKHCSGLDPTWRHKLYKKGLFMPEDGTIANTAIYLALIEGYKTIELYGADHNMFLEFQVNDNNELCSLDSHYYDKEKPRYKPFYNCNVTDGRVWRVHEFMYVLYVMFYSHDLLRQFADYMGAKIINCTPGSMIDSYERK